MYTSATKLRIVKTPSDRPTVRTRRKWGRAFFALSVGGKVFSVVVALFLVQSARTRGVESVGVPVASAISRWVEGSFYTDSYRVSLAGARFETLEELAAAAFRKGQEVGRTEREIVFRRTAPGVVYYISYLLEAEKSLVVTTVVHAVAPRGRRYFFFVRPVHRVLTPFLTGRMSAAA
mgnify:FL=1